jgi:Holliday junction resolvase
MTNSREKGKKGELEWAKYLRDHGFEARRGRQYQGNDDAPDVVTELDDLIHFEVKRVERFYPYRALEQAMRDGGDELIPVVAHRPNNKDWSIFMTAKDFIFLMKELLDAPQERQSSDLGESSRAETGQQEAKETGQETEIP